MAVNCCVVPLAMLGLCGVTWMATRETTAAPRSLSHPAEITTRSNAINHIILLNVLEYLVPVRICVPSFL
jgi:hypothetical protein